MRLYFVYSVSDYEEEGIMRGVHFAADNEQSCIDYVKREFPQLEDFQVPTAPYFGKTDEDDGMPIWMIAVWDEEPGNAHWDEAVLAFMRGM